MFPEMRRKDRQIAVEGTAAILERAAYGTLSTIGPNGYPYGVPMSFVAWNGKLYFHCAENAGSKLANIAENPKVCFTVVGETTPIPEKFSTEYESVIVFGTAAELDKNEGTARAALAKLIEKYSGDYIEAGARYIETLYDKVAVYEINVEHISGKERKKDSRHNLEILGHKEAF